MAKKLVELAADLVQAQASTTQMSPEEMELALSRVFLTLQRIKVAEEKGAFLHEVESEGVAVEEGAPGQINPYESIQENKVICLECGAEMRQLTANHLRSHGLTPRDYKRKWGFTLKQSLAAKSLTRFRSRAAKKRGLPENLVRYLEKKQQEKLGTTPLEAPVQEAPAVEAPPEERPGAEAAPKRRRRQRQ